MTRPTFMEGAAVAFVTAVVSGVLFTVLSSLLYGGPVLRLVITLLSLSYVFYLLGRSRRRTGRMVTIAVWVPTAAALWWTAPPLWMFVPAHLAFVWLVRSLYFHSSTLSALADLGLTALGLAAAAWAAVQTHSFFASVWCFFLVQALFVAIPARWRGARRPHDTGEDDRFQRAHAAAESAMRRLSDSQTQRGI